jgi:two-component system nitrogen regulation sensor histidine kinase NtrY
VNSQIPASRSGIVAEPADAPITFSRRFTRWAHRVGMARKLAIGLTVAALVSGIATYIAFTGSSPLGPDPKIVLFLLNLDLVLLLLLGAVVARRIVNLWVERRRGQAGSRLHVRLVVLFSIVAVTPAILVAVFSALFFNFGIQAWFSERVRVALHESLAVTDAYLEEHTQAIRADVLAMANDINRDAPLLARSSLIFQRMVEEQAAARSIAEAIVFDGSGRVLASAGLSFALQLEPIPDFAMDKARNGEVAIITSQDDTRVRALVRLDRFFDTFLYVGRFIEPGVIAHVKRTQAAVAEYERLEGQRSGVQISFFILFAVVALLLLLAAVWVGLLFANKLIGPIGGLISAAERVGAGDLSARVQEVDTEDEIGGLSRAFNRMTAELERHSQELVEANRQLDARRKFTETVLAGVSAGVIGLNAKGRINLPNRSAAELLSTELETKIGQKLAHAVPEMAELLKRARRSPDRLHEAELHVLRNGRARTLLVRIAAERIGGEIIGFVVTFDDITELQSAQRKAAWADVARRIAHEIKNPLTPIQLSAERLKRKYLKEIKSEPDVFETCTDTIVRQVTDIGRMVDEFSAFARMPAPVMKPEDIGEICRQAVFLQSNAHPTIQFATEFPAKPLDLPCDRRQISQAVTNLLQNAVDSIGERLAQTPGDDRPGRIALRVVARDDARIIEVEDNGQGLPADLLPRLTEPYVTTRKKGTGLGLAIVRKIMEDHGGEVVLENAEGGGARVRLVFGMTEMGERPAETGSTGTAKARKTVRTAVHGS